MTLDDLDLITGQQHDLYEEEERVLTAAYTNAKHLLIFR